MKLWTLAKWKFAIPNSIIEVLPFSPPVLVIEIQFWAKVKGPIVVLIGNTLENTFGVSRSKIPK